MTTTERQIDERSSEFIEKRIIFDTIQALRVQDELGLHREEGLLGINGKDWENVTRHELHVTERVNVFLSILGLSSEVSRKAEIASAVHDLSKRREKGSLAPGQTVSWEWYKGITKEADQLLRDNGYDEETVRLAGSMGHSAIKEANRILDQADQDEELPELDVAYLVINYVDGFTINNNWVVPASESADGELINEADRRADKGKFNPSLAQLEKDGFERFGISTAEAMRNVSHRAEKYLAKELSNRLGEDIEPIRLPEFIDQKLKEQIAGV